MQLTLRFIHLIFGQLLIWDSLVGVCFGAKDELFSSIVNLQNLLHSESEAIQRIEDYIEKEEQRLIRLKELANKPIPGSKQILGNPVNTYLFIKNWLNSELMNEIKTNSHAHEALVGLDAVLPSSEDLEGAVKGLVRLQLTYDISTADLAHGKAIPGLNTTSLTSDDCLAIGKIMYSTENFYYSLEWLEESWERAMREPDVTLNGKLTILDYLSWAYSKTGNLQRAYWTAKRAVGLQGRYPDEHSQSSMEYFVNEIHEADLPVPRNDRDLPPAVNYPPEKTTEMNLYDRLCHEPIDQNDHTLVCRFKRTTAYTRLAPFKEEILSWDPPVSIFRSVLADSENDYLIDLATPQAWSQQTLPKRVFKFFSAWMRDVSDPIVRAVNDRIADFTKLDMRSAEFLQMANYGIAGQYEPHFDMSIEEDGDPYDDDLGNRVATVLFYFNKPLAGGGTVFGDLKLLVSGNKGDALFWYNLHRNGTADKRMKHAACPVLAGQKWVGNKWIRSHGQEFVRPCTLSQWD